MRQKIDSLIFRETKNAIIGINLYVQTHVSS